MRSRLVPITVGVLLAASAAGASAQIRTEAEEAEARFNAATASLSNAATQRAITLNDLVGAIDEWRDIIDEQTGVAYAVGELQSTIAAGELRTAELKDVVRQRTVDAYMAGGSSMLGTLFGAETLTEVATAQFVMESLGRQADADLDALGGQQAELETLRAELTVEEALLVDRNERVVTLVDELDILFAEASTQVAESHQTLLAADTDYREAYELLQQMTELQRATGRGTERWRPIVEHYFPAERVDQAMEVMWCESRGNPQATHPLSDASGLFQFMEQTWGFVSPLAGFDGASRYDPEANIASAAWLLNFTIERGHALGDWGRWSCQPTTQVP